MPPFDVIPLRDLLRTALRGKLARGWFYLPAGPVDLATPVLFITGDVDDLEAAAASRGFPVEGLDTDTLISTARGARSFERKPSDELLLEAFVYYHRHDAYLPRPGAPEPPSRSQIELRLDREFYDTLGPERAEVPCREPGCTRGSVSYSVLCRPHHFASVKRKASPFRD